MAILRSFTEVTKCVNLEKLNEVVKVAILRSLKKWQFEGPLNVAILTKEVFVD